MATVEEPRQPEKRLGQTMLPLWYSNSTRSYPIKNPIGLAIGTHVQQNSWFTPLKYLELYTEMGLECHSSSSHLRPRAGRNTARSPGRGQAYAWSNTLRCEGLTCPRLCLSQLATRTSSLSQVHASGMKVGLKNALDMVEDVVDCFDFAINESCIYYEECGVRVYKNILPRFALRSRAAPNFAIGKQTVQY